MINGDVSVRCGKAKVYPRGDGAIDVDLEGVDIPRFVRKADVYGVLDAVAGVIGWAEVERLARQGFAPKPAEPPETDTGDLTSF